MEIYLIIVIALLALAISDLIVGVTNDAVNFLNSAIGAKVAPFKVIMVVASIGIMLGAMFSNGMMEVARKGVFYPESFNFHEMMILFFAVMVTDILLLDFFNTLGLPTSTTVSIVFELLGAAVAVAVVKISDSGAAFSTMGEYINSGNSLIIITSILISIVVAFSAGTIIQYLSRLLFTFKYEKKFKYIGAIWGGMSISFILYFIIVKGAKGSTIISSDTIKYIEANSALILLGTFVVCSVLLQLIQLIFKFNTLKIVVLFGTFGLAMAFAGNDLVNFIGVPIAGLNSYQEFTATGAGDATSFSMDFLNNDVKTDNYLLVIAGIVMLLTLWLSSKARTVTDTEVSLGRQDSGFEKFGSSLLARSIIRQSLGLNTLYQKILPDSFIEWSRKRFEVPVAAKTKDNASFDLIRATVNLTVSSILIAFATSLKLPLSTTYVTFMVAMGTSLSDGAWGRESAVYRVTGVLTVIGGWFITALAAFTVSMVIAFVVNWGGIYAVLGFIAMTILFVYRTHIVHKKNVKTTKEAKELMEYETGVSSNEILAKCNSSTREILNLSSGILMLTLQGLANEDRKLLKQTRQNAAKLIQKAKHIKSGIPATIKLIGEGESGNSHKYIQMVDYLREITRSTKEVIEHSSDHVENGHEPLNAIQNDELRNVISATENILSMIAKQTKVNDFSDTEEIKRKQAALDEMINKFSQNQVERMATEKTNSKSVLLYMNLLFELGNIATDSIHLVKAQRVFNSMEEEQSNAD